MPTNKKKSRGAKTSCSRDSLNESRNAFHDASMKFICFSDKANIFAAVFRNEENNAVVDVEDLVLEYTVSAEEWSKALASGDDTDTFRNTTKEVLFGRLMKGVKDSYAEMNAACQLLESINDAELKVYLPQIIQQQDSRINDFKNWVHASPEDTRALEEKMEESEKALDILFTKLLDVKLNWGRKNLIEIAVYLDNGTIKPVRDFRTHVDKKTIDDIVQEKTPGVQLSLATTKLFRSKRSLEKFRAEFKMLSKMKLEDPEALKAIAAEKIESSRERDVRRKREARIQRSQRQAWNYLDEVAEYFGGDVDDAPGMTIDEQEEENLPPYVCPHCQSINTGDVRKCRSCKVERVWTGWSGCFVHLPKTWVCPTCTQPNLPGTDQCITCTKDDDNGMDGGEDGSALSGNGFQFNGPGITSGGFVFAGAPTSATTVAPTPVAASDTSSGGGFRSAGATTTTTIAPTPTHEATDTSSVGGFRSAGATTTTTIAPTPEATYTSSGGGFRSAGATTTTTIAPTPEATDTSSGGGFRSAGASATTTSTIEPTHEATDTSSGGFLSAGASTTIAPTSAGSNVQDFTTSLKVSFANTATSSGGSRFARESATTTIAPTPTGSIANDATSPKVSFTNTVTPFTNTVTAFGNSKMDDDESVDDLAFSAEMAAEEAKSDAKIQILACKLKKVEISEGNRKKLEAAAKNQEESANNRVEAAKLQIQATKEGANTITLLDDVAEDANGHVHQIERLQELKAKTPSRKNRKKVENLIISVATKRKEAVSVSSVAKYQTPTDKGTARKVLFTESGYD